MLTNKIKEFLCQKVSFYCPQDKKLAKVHIYILRLSL